MKTYTTEEIELSMQDKLFREAFGPNWDRVKAAPKPLKFQRGYGYEIPSEFIGWEWSTTFGRWGAVVKWEDGSEWYTYPKI